MNIRGLEGIVYLLKKIIILPKQFHPFSTLMGVSTS